MRIHATFAAVAALALAAGLAAPAFAGVANHMVSVDTTQGPIPVVHDNGVNDGRVCKIFFRQVWNEWTEDFEVRKVKRCI